jgi:hypothetical protein
MIRGRKWLDAKSDVKSYERARPPTLLAMGWSEPVRCVARSGGGGGGGGEEEEGGDDATSNSNIRTVCTPTASSEG